MTDTSGSSAANPAPAPGQKPPEARRSIPVWVWIVVAIVVVLILGGLFTTQTSTGKLWLLGLRGMVQVPNVVGQSQTQAQTTLEAAGMRLGQVSDEPTLAVPPGTVVAQTPAADTTAKKDSAVDVSVASLPTAQVPNVVGQTESDAVTLLAEEGLRAGTLTYVYSSTTAAGKVTAQTPSASTQTTVGAAVDLTISKGTQQGQVPNVIGLSQNDANSVITAAGFKVTTLKATSSSVPAGDVSAQSPAAGVVTASGSTVTITVSTGAPAPAPAPSPAPTSSTPPTSQNPTSPPANQPTKVSVPNVVGQGVRDAVTAISAAKLKVSFQFAPSKGNFLKVTEQAPTAGASVDPGSTVVITIGLPSISLPAGKPTQPTPLPAEPPATVATTQPTAQPAPAPAPAPAPTQLPATAPSASVPTTP